MPNFIPFRANETIVASDLIDAYRGFCGLGEDKLPRNDNGEVTTDLINIGSPTNPYNELYVNSVNSDIFNTVQSITINGVTRNIYGDTGVLDFHYEPPQTTSNFDGGRIFPSVADVFGSTTANRNLINSVIESRSLLARTVYFLLTRHHDEDLITGNDINTLALSSFTNDPSIREIEDGDDFSTETNRDADGVFIATDQGTDYNLITGNINLIESPFEIISGNTLQRALMQMRVAPAPDIISATMLTPQRINGNNFVYHEDDEGDPDLDEPDFTHYNTWLAYRTLSKVRIILL